MSKPQPSKSAAAPVAAAPVVAAPAAATEAAAPAARPTDPMDAARRLAAAWLAAWEKPAATAAAAMIGDPRTLAMGGAWMAAQQAMQRAWLTTIDAMLTRPA